MSATTGLPARATSRRARRAPRSRPSRRRGRRRRRRRRARVERRERVALDQSSPSRQGRRPQRCAARPRTSRVALERHHVPSDDPRAGGEPDRRVAAGAAELEHLAPGLRRDEREQEPPGGRRDLPRAQLGRKLRFALRRVLLLEPAQNTHDLVVEHTGDCRGRIYPARAPRSGQLEPHPAVLDPHAVRAHGDVGGQRLRLARPDIELASRGGGRRRCTSPRRSRPRPAGPSSCEQRSSIA